MKRYTFEIIQRDDNLRSTSTNYGFTPMELLGILELKKVDVIKQIEGQIEPEIEYKRTVIKDEPEINKCYTNAEIILLEDIQDFRSEGLSEDEIIKTLENILERIRA